jgi:hypothetical protein
MYDQAVALVTDTRQASISHDSEAPEGGIQPGGADDREDGAGRRGPADGSKPRKSTPGSCKVDPIPGEGQGGR